MDIVLKKGSKYCIVLKRISIHFQHFFKFSADFAVPEFPAVHCFFFTNQFGLSQVPSSSAFLDYLLRSSAYLGDQISHAANITGGPSKNEN